MDVGEEGVGAEGEFSTVGGGGGVVEGEDCDGSVCAGDGDGVLGVVIAVWVGELCD